MNRTLAIVSAAIVTAGLALSAATAADGEAGPLAKGIGATSRPGASARIPLEKAIKDLDLTEQQQKQMQTILDAHRQALQNWRKEYGEGGKTAGAAPDKERAAKGRQARRELMENTLKQIADVLTKEQMQKVKAALAPKGGALPGGMGLIEKLNLTDDQKARMKDIVATAHADAQKAADPAAKRKAIAAGFEKIKAEVLTEEQRQELEKIKAAMAQKAPAAPGMGPIGKLNLTDDQKAKINDIVKAAKESAAKAQGQEKAKVWKDTLKKIESDILTDGQRKQLDELKKHARESHKANAGPKTGTTGPAK